MTIIVTFLVLVKCNVCGSIGKVTAVDVEDNTPYCPQCRSMDYSCWYDPEWHRREEWLEKLKTEGVLK